MLSDLDQTVQGSTCRSGSKGRTFGGSATLKKNGRSLVWEGSGLEEVEVRTVDGFQVREAAKRNNGLFLVSRLLRP